MTPGAQDDAPQQAAPTAGGARRLKSCVRPLCAWAAGRRAGPASSSLTADALALLPPPAERPPLAPTLRAAAACSSSSSSSSSRTSPAAQTRATLALRVPLWPARRRGEPQHCQQRREAAAAEADVAVRLPPGLRLASTSRGLPDLRLDLLDVLVSWGGGGEGGGPAHGLGDHDPSSYYGGVYHRVYPARQPAAALAVRGGALLLAHALLPDAAARLGPMLALPAAAVDVAAPLALALAPRRVRRAARDLWGGAGRADGRGGEGLPPPEARDGSGRDGGDDDGNNARRPSLLPPPRPFCPPAPVRLAAAAAHAAVHALRAMSPPAAMLASVAWLWRIVEPNSLLLLKATAALAATSADYNGLRRDAALGRFDDDGDGHSDDEYCAPWASDDEGADGEGGRRRGRSRGRGRRQLDAARRRVHRRAARRVAPFMRDLPEGEGAGVAAPLAPALAALGRLSVAAALAVGGVTLSGSPAAAGGGGALGAAGEGATACAWLGWDATPAQPQLLLSVVVDAGVSEAAAAAREARRHAASGLDRGELLSLFLANEREEEADEAAAPATTTTTTTTTAGKAATPVLVDVDACCSSSCSSPTGSQASAPEEEGGGCGDRRDPPLTFLERLPLYGRPEAQAGAPAAAAAAPAASPSPGHREGDDDDAAAIVVAGREGRAAAARAEAEAEPALRAARLLIAFLPFVLAGLPLLAAAAALMARARERERQALGGGGAGDDEEEEDEEQGQDGHDDDDDDAFWRDPAKQQKAAEAWRRRHQAHQARRAEAERQRRLERELEAQVLGEQQAALARALRAQLAALRAALAGLAALLELLLLLALGGDWMAAAAGGGGGGAGGGGGPFEAAALRLRRAAWSLLVGGCARSGAAVIKCGQWAAVRRDLFSGDLCDALSRLHDDAPAHAPAQTRRALARAGMVVVVGGEGSETGGRGVARCVFESFDWEPVASGSIAQVHRAVLRLGGEGVIGSSSSSALINKSDDADGLVVAVKVRHPGVARHIAMDFLLLHRLAALVERAWLWSGARVAAASGRRGLARPPPPPPPPPLVHTLAQFSRTMAAQADLRVEAVHMLRFARDFGGGGAVVDARRGGKGRVPPPPPPLPIAVPLPLPGLASADVLVETFEPGASVGRHLAAAVAERAALDRRARERRLERRRRERECAERQQQQQEQEQEQEQEQREDEAEAGGRARAALLPPPLPPPPRQGGRSRLATARTLLGRAASVLGRALSSGRQAWCERRRGLRQRRRQRRQQSHQQQSQQQQPPCGSSSITTSGQTRSQIVALFLEAWLKMLLDTGFMHQDLHPGNLLVRPRGSGGGGGVGGGGSNDDDHDRQQQQQQQQLVLLDFGLAEELPPDVRLHFTSFLNHVAAGNAAHATRHLLRWSSAGAELSAAASPRGRGALSTHQKRALLADVAEMFAAAGPGLAARAIDLDAVLSRTLALVRRHGLSLDGSYALLCMGCCSLVRAAAALDPRFNLMDALAPELLAHAVLGRTLGGCTAGL
jgi:predicted unusual protein kinase regulating ubiquinone biosynthesis (AarF/ABC1/UbiB family)